MYGISYSSSSPDRWAPKPKTPYISRSGYGEHLFAEVCPTRVMDASENHSRTKMAADKSDACGNFMLGQAESCATVRGSKDAANSWAHFIGRNGVQGEPATGLRVVASHETPPGQFSSPMTQWSCIGWKLADGVSSFAKGRQVAIHIEEIIESPEPWNVVLETFKRMFPNLGNYTAFPVDIPVAVRHCGPNNLPIVECSLIR